jgi:hypothetical protein
MYVAGYTTVDSFLLDNFEKDGTAFLLLADGSSPAPGNTAQVSVADNNLIITLKTDPTPGTVDVIRLRKDGSVSHSVKAIAAPPNTLTPFGFHVAEDGTALITLAHSNNIGLFKNNAFVDVISISQNAPCWSTGIGKYIFSINTSSKTITRYLTSGQQIFVDAIVAASITSGNPTDADQNSGYLVVLVHSATTSYLNFFQVDNFGDLTSNENSIDIEDINANGVSIMVPVN